MKILLLFLLFFANLYGAAVLNYEFYPRSDRFDLMITFSKGFEGEIKRESAKNMIVVTLKNASIYENIKKSFDNKLVSEVRIYQEGEDLNILFATNTKLNLTASKTSQGMGLRLRLKEDASSKSEEAQLPQPQTKDATTQQSVVQGGISGAEFKDDGVSMVRYLGVLTLLLLLVSVLLFLKRKIGTKESKNWLFSSLITKNGEVRILSQKQLDMKNRIVVFEVGTKQYTVLIGHNNYLLLDKTESAKKRGSGFDAMLGDNEERLNSYLELENKRYDDLKLENYKRKAGTLYDE